MRPGQAALLLDDEDFANLETRRAEVGLEERGGQDVSPGQVALFLGDVGFAHVETRGAEVGLEVGT